MKAYLWEPLEDNKVKCNLCNHRCVIKDGRRGKCSVRENRSGVLNTLVYGISISCRVVSHIPLQQSVVISNVYSAKTPILLKCRPIIKV
jgi:hypothetical protein